MFKKLVPLLCVSMLSVMPNSSFAGGPDFESLFGKNSSQQLVFNMCGGGDGELKDICRNLNSDLSYTFSSNHTLTITTPDGKQTAKWKAKGQEVYVTQPGSSSFKEASEYTFCEGQYLASYSEESGDLIAMKMQKLRIACITTFVGSPLLFIFLDGHGVPSPAPLNRNTFPTSTTIKFSERRIAS